MWGISSLIRASSARSLLPLTHQLEPAPGMTMMKGWTLPDLIKCLVRCCQSMGHVTSRAQDMAGAGGTIGVAAASKAMPDGYTLLITSASTQIVQPVVRKTMPYDAEKDFIPILSTGGSASVVMVHPSLPVKNLRELIEYARTNPDVVT